MMRREYDSPENVPLDILSGPGTESTGGGRNVETSELPSRRVDDFSGQRLQLRRRIWTRQRSTVVHDVVEGLPSHNLRGDMSAGESVPTAGRRTEGSGLEHHATQIVSEMERDQTLMQDNPQAELLRMETLREMPESLTLKRSIRRKLVKKVSQKSQRSPTISVWRRAKYSCSMSADKLNVAAKNVLYGLEPWYQGLKVIEGHFGSGVATYFKFLRWLFVLDLTVCIMSVSFVVVPQLLYRFYEPHDANSSRSLDAKLYEDINTTDSILVSVTPLPMTFPFPQFREARSVSVETEPPLVVRQDPYRANSEFSFADIFTGEGFFTNTTLYYGYYVNDSLHLTPNAWYSIPNAYFFSAFACYLFLFVAVSISMARSYRHSFIETSGGLKNIYAQKVFCGWDFSIATSEAARLKSKSIYNELKELLSDASVDNEERSFKTIFISLSVQVLLNVVCLVVISGTALLMWFLLDSHSGNVMVVSLVATAIMLLAPMLFSWFLRFEGYRNPRTALYVTLSRTFLLEVVVVGVLVAFWLQQTTTECWETSLGQETYRLILVDFVFTIVGTALAEFSRSQIYRFWPAIGVPEFDIARNTLNLIYNQTLFWVGAFFSPLLSVIIVIKMFITFYVKKMCVLNNCRPSTRSWRAAQTQTMFLVLSFLSLLGVVMTYGYIMTQVRTSDGCGPFRDYDYMYRMVLEGVLQLQENNSFWKLIMFLTKPGVVAGLLLAMCVGVYYLRAKSLARQHMVVFLREMLVLEAKDKEFLLSNISKVTDGRWMYNLPRSHPPDTTSPHVSGAAGGDQGGVEPRYRGSNSTLTSQEWRQSGGTSTPDAVSSIDSVGPSHRFSDPRRSSLQNSRLNQVRIDTSDESYPASDDGLNDYEGSRIRNMRNKHIYEQEVEGVVPPTGRSYRF